jgi:hypothetical protein
LSVPLLPLLLLAYLPVCAAERPFPVEFTASVGRALSVEPFYASKLVGSLQTQVAALCNGGDPRMAAKYLETQASGGASLAAVKAAMLKGTLTAEQASAILAANALSRPDQLPEVLDGLEGIKPGLGKTAAAVLSKADGKGDRRLIAALRAAGRRQPQPAGALYGRDGKLDSLFDGGSAGIVTGKAGDAVPVIADGVYGYGADGKPRPSGLMPSKRY